MPEISKKGHNMPQSPIRKLVPYAEEATKKGKKVYYLNIGQPDIKTPTIAMNAIRSSSLDILAYSRSEGSEEYRKKIVKYYLPVDNATTSLTPHCSAAWITFSAPSTLVRIHSVGLYSAVSTCLIAAA